MFWSKGIIWSPHIYLFGQLPCKWWRGVNVVMSQGEGRECIIAFCNVSPGSLYSLLKKTLESEDSLEKIKSLHQSSGGLQVCTAHFTLECSEKNLFTRPKDFFSCVFCTRINEDRNHSHDCGFKLLRPHWTCYCQRLLSQPDRRMSCDFCE